LSTSSTETARAAVPAAFADQLAAFRSARVRIAVEHAARQRQDLARLARAARVLAGAPQVRNSTHGCWQPSGH
jgi:hypothetical protein